MCLGEVLGYRTVVPAATANAGQAIEANPAPSMSPCLQKAITIIANISVVIDPAMSAIRRSYVRRRLPAASSTTGISIEVDWELRRDGGGNDLRSPTWEAATYGVSGAGRSQSPGRPLGRSDDPPRSANGQR